MKYITLFYVLLFLSLSFEALAFIPSRAVKEDKPEFFLVILVNARHLDYQNVKRLFSTIAKHPSDASKNGDVGHCWIYLQGCVDGKQVIVEGGHSGELGLERPKYFDGVMNLWEYGYLAPSEEQKACPRYEPNPVKYLWTSTNDGFFQQGAGHHHPTYAVEVELTQQQYVEILHFIENYDFKEYSIRNHQCCTFATQVAQIAGLSIEDKIEVELEPVVQVCGVDVRLWSAPCYSKLIFSSPDIVERSMKKAVAEGKAKNALQWYYKKRPYRLEHKLCEWKTSIERLPERWQRAVLFRG